MCEGRGWGVCEVEGVGGVRWRGWGGEMEGWGVRWRGVGVCIHSHPILLTGIPYSHLPHAFAMDSCQTFLGEGPTHATTVGMRAGGGLEVSKTSARWHLTGLTSSTVK